MKTKLTNIGMVAGLVLLGITSSTLNATPISGDVNLTGSAGVSATVVDFFGVQSSNCSTPGAGTIGCFLINVPISGNFATLLPGTVGGTIQDLAGPPISGPISLLNFIMFNNGVVFDLTTVQPGGAPNCATVNGNLPNVSCTPVIGGQVSPFVLTNSASGTNASVFFNVDVNAYTGTSASGISKYTGAFNTPSAGKNITGILSDIAGGKTVSAAYSANFTGSAVVSDAVVVPEPQTGVMIGLGMLALVLGGFRSKRGAGSNT
jgi:hypothetical protein